MIRKLVVVLLSGLICALLLGVTPVLAQETWSLSEYQKATGKTIDSFSEAPMLRVMVAAGELPPVGERLPEDPLVVEPVEEIGQYGGTLNAFSVDDTSYDDGNMLRGFRTLMVFDPGLKNPIPYIAKGVEISEDAKSVTLYLRKGMKWSDGVLFTADDILFFWEDVVLNDELMPTKWDFYKPGGELWEVEKIDDYTVRYSFAVPQISFIQDYFTQFVGVEGSAFWPKHYHKQFHANYTSAEELAKTVEREGFDNWVDMWNTKKRLAGWGSYLAAPETPTLGPWLLKDEGVNWWLLERNPYYFAVDTAGNQLPYIDQIFITNVGNQEVYNAKIVSGEADFAVYYTTMDNYTLYVESAEAADYRVLNWAEPAGSISAVFINQTIIDPTLRKIFQDVRFRRAISLAIDREDINEALFYGLGTPRQHTVIPDSKYYEESFATAYVQYDPAEANRLLDEMGLDERDAEGYRLRADGKRLSLLVEFTQQTSGVPMSELLKEYWQAIGIDITLKLLGEQLYGTRSDGNEIQMDIWPGVYSTDVDFPRQQIDFGVPTGVSQIRWGPLWGRWYASDGKDGEEPPEEVKKNIERYEKILVATDEEELIRLAKEILASQADNLWTIGTVGLAPRLMIVKNYLRNVPERATWEWGYLFLNNYRPEQFFLKK